eukprot:TRINITY_DN10052_c1_g2_i1.p1 TRINITY_DN10052_c1_g2~~TRINITY_DN10052_c1_g2_i1.p1  ORF type:complete len:299 (+),score=34.14 TRINITY_DN10052_c1_g2_i1:87-983(+)
MSVICGHDPPARLSSCSKSYPKHAEHELGYDDLSTMVRAQLHALHDAQQRLRDRKQRPERRSSGSNSQQRDGPAIRRRGPLPAHLARHAPQNFGSMEWKRPPCEHEEALRRQLGHLPPNLIDVAAFNPRTGAPAVARLYPLRSNPGAYKAKERTTLEPFPTMFWLSCPELSAAVARLESTGWVEKLEDRVNSCEESRQVFATQHAAYAAERWALLTPGDEALALAQRWDRPLREKGIAGISDIVHIKCLHTHYAHYLGSGGQNLVGKWVAELLEAQEREDALARERQNSEARARSNGE